MTPAAKPIMISSNLRLIFLKKKTMADPTMVQPQVKRPASKAKRPHFDVKAKSQTHPPTNGQKDWLRTDFQVSSHSNHTQVSKPQVSQQSLG